MVMSNFISNVNSSLYNFYVREGVLTGTSKLLLWTVTAEKLARCLKVFCFAQNRGNLSQRSPLSGHFHTNLFVTGALAGTLSLNVIPGSARAYAATYSLWVYLNSYTGNQNDRKTTNDYCDRLIRLPADIFWNLHKITEVDKNPMMGFWMVVILPATAIACAAKYGLPKVLPTEISW